MLKFVHGLAAGAILVSAYPANAKVFTATAANIVSVFKHAAAGDRIVLRGSFGAVVLANRTFSRTVTIDARAATFSGKVKFGQVNRLNWIGGRFLLPPSALSYDMGLVVQNSNNMSFSSLNVTGRDTGQGIRLVNSRTVSVADSSFNHLRVGVALSGITGATISNNTSRASSSDGFNVADSHNVLVSRNSCSGTVPSPGAHADCVQLWSISGRRPNSDITISDNTAIGSTQGFTSFDATAGGGDRISILRNRVDTSWPQGIACYNCRNSLISGNIVTTLPGSAHQTLINVIGGANNRVFGNSVGARPTPATKAVAFSVDALQFDDATKIELSDSTAPFAAADNLRVLDAAGAIPEPATWATMLAGFLIAGAAMRRRRRTAVAV